MYDEVKVHIQEMLDVGVIRPSNSPWASAVVLVQKKDGKLWFCIDLQKLNPRAVKDAYSHPRIDETCGLHKWGRMVLFFGFNIRVLASRDGGG